MVRYSDDVSCTRLVVGVITIIVLANLLTLVDVGDDSDALR